MNRENALDLQYGIRHNSNISFPPPSLIPRPFSTGNEDVTATDWIHTTEKLVLIAQVNNKPLLCPYSWHQKSLDYNIILCNSHINNPLSGELRGQMLEKLVFSHWCFSRMFPVTISEFIFYSPKCMILIC